jgi:hypothetical protein
METTNLKDSRMAAIFDLYDLHTGFFTKVIAGISDEDAHNRLGTKANHVAWLAGSIVESRYAGARNFGLDEKQTSDELFKNHQGIKDDAAYPPLAQLQKDWEHISPILRAKTMEQDTAWLDTRRNMEGWDASNREMITFMTYREANMIGQIALWRRLLDYPAMSYMP